MATGKIENILNKMGTLAQEISWQNVEVPRGVFFWRGGGVVFCFQFLVAYREM